MASNSSPQQVAIEDAGLTAFYRDMTPPERGTFWACASGWALDGMDFMIYPRVVGTIIAMWKVDAGMAGCAGTVTLLASAIGGWIAGATVAGPPYADTVPFAQALGAARPQRCVWGSDWPHVANWGVMMSVADLLDVFARWVPDPQLRRQILVDNAHALFGF